MAKAYLNAQTAAILARDLEIQLCSSVTAIPPTSSVKQEQILFMLLCKAPESITGEVACMWIYYWVYLYDEK